MNIKTTFNKIIKNMQDNYNIFMYISFFIILFYPFNIAIREIICPNDFILLGLNIVALVILFIVNFQDIKKTTKNIPKKFIFVLGLLLGVILIRNGDIINGHYGVPFFTIASIIMMCILSTSKRWYKIAINVIMVYVIEHVCATWFSFFFPEVYFKNILPLFPEFEKELIYQFNHNQIAGFTFHYSTNATYLLIGVIIEYFNLNIKKENIKNKNSICKIICFMLTIGALLLTGKRAQPIFGILSILVVVIIKNIRNLKDTLKKICISMITIILSILMISIFIPSILNPIKRVNESFKNKDMFITRKPMFDLAIKEFNENPIVGNGWGTFKYEYNSQVINKEREYMDTHNIYLQMLSEVGILGIALVIGIWTYMIYKAIRLIIENKNNSFIYIYLTMQIYFILEGIVGNPIYDIQELIPYMIFTSVIFSKLNINNYCIRKEKNKMKEDGKILTISVAAYNIENMIEKNLQSFVNSKIKDEIEVIVTDDGSKDNTPKIVEEYQNKYPGIVKLVKQENAGPGSTVNSGIKNATGKYFKMVDGDDWVETKNLEEFIGFLKNIDSDMVLSNYKEYDNKENKICKINKVALPNKEEFKFSDICSNLDLQMHNVTFKTSILQNNNIALDNGFYTDVEYLLLPTKYINTISYIDLDIYIYRVAQAGQSVSIPSMQKNIKMHDIVLKRLINYYEENKSKIDNKKKQYIGKRIAIMANTQLGTLLTFENNEKNKNNIIKFNEELKKLSDDIYKLYKKMKKAKLLIISKYRLYNVISKIYTNKIKRK